MSSSKTAPSTNTITTQNTKNYVILDCDGGSDDAWALLLLLKADDEKQIVLLGVTICGSGNTSLHNAAGNMLRILKARGRDEIPIFLGAPHSLIPKPYVDKRQWFHGHDGFGDCLPLDVGVDIEDMVEGEMAVAAINQFCKENPKQVTLIAVGPLTNIAICYSMYGKNFANNVKDIFIMGGNYQGVGNFTRCAEFNFYADPEAAHVVLASSICPITIMPWECCMEDRFFICFKWRLNELGAAAARFNPAIEILNLVERVQWMPSNFKGWNPCDAMLAGVFLFGSQFIRKESHWHATVELHGWHTRGQMVLDHMQDVDKFPKNVRIIEQVDAQFFKRVALWGACITDLKMDSKMGLTNQSIK